MAKINDTTTYPNTTPVLTDHLPGTDVSNTTNDANGETVTFLLSAVRTLLQANLTKAEISPGNNDNGLTISGSSLTGSDATSLIDLSQTWNTTGAPTAIKLNVTDTASDAASLAIDLQVDGATIFNVRASDGRIEGSGTQRFTPASNGWLFGTGNTRGYMGGTNTAGTHGISLGSGAILTWQPTANPTGWGSDVGLMRDGADTLAQRRYLMGSDSQSFNIYAGYGSSTDYHRMGIKTAITTLSSVSGASVTATSLIPDGAVVVGVTTKVTTGLGTSNGTTGYNVGDGTDPDRWGAVSGTASGTSSDNTDWTDGTVTCFTAANDVVLTAVGGNFDGTGVIDVAVMYLTGEAD